MAEALQHQPHVDENAGSRSLATFQRENPPTFKGEEITWTVFRRELLGKYYSEDVPGKEIEFLKLKHGNLSVTEYAAKFVELAKFYPHYSKATFEFLKCIKFESNLHPEIKKAIGYQKIRNFPNLVDSCRIYQEDNNARYNIFSEKRGKHQHNHGKPYDAPAAKGKQEVVEGQTTSGRDAPAVFCVSKWETWSQDGEEGYISSQCQKSKKAQAGGEVFALARTQTTTKDGLIRGACFINSTSLITIIDIGDTHCFIIADCAEKFDLLLSSMNGEMVVDTPAKGSVTTSLVFLKCPILIFNRDFAVDLVCLLLHGLDVILSMNWLEYNYVHINCYNKSMQFSTPDEEEETGLLSAKQLQKLMQEEARVFFVVGIVIC
ncbi:uncharacterized protein LOC131598200 [Vicia villosa]|uniref:uncharacterized protein LOC131598200 n=1 Tax=Vicia villosa TaxID=3911 RepID=UPI00273AF1DC|nr:uncharacterized protein LOC131598200 [Vicia villosa]